MPHDLRAAILTVQESLELTTVQWSAILLLTEDGSVDTPPVVDHLRRVGLVYDFNSNSWTRGSSVCH